MQAIIDQNDFLSRNATLLKRYLILFAAIALFLVAGSYLLGKQEPALLFALICGVFLLAISPLVATCVFLNFLFIGIEIGGLSAHLLSDLAALGVVASASVYLFLKGRWNGSFPPLTDRFLWLVAAVTASALASTRPELGLTSIARLLLMFSLFWAANYVVGILTVKRVLHLFLTLATCYSLPVIWEFVAAGGSARSFGVTRQIFDDLALIAIPLALTGFLCARLGYRVYLIPLGVVSIGLVGTQSRAALLLAPVCSVVVTIVCYWYAPTGNGHDSKSSDGIADRRSIRRKVWWIAACALLLTAGFFALQPGLFGGLSDRFSVLMGGGRYGESYVPRWTLWTVAFRAFVENPFFGIGPGNFRAIVDIYPELSMSYYYFWVKGLSAHNLFLHYLAETGLVGITAVIALFGGAFNRIRQRVRNAKGQEVTSVMLLSVAILFLITLFTEAGWLWARTGLAFAFFLGLISRACMSPHQRKPVSETHELEA